MQKVDVTLHAISHKERLTYAWRRSTMHYALCTEEGVEKTGGSHGDDTATCHPATARHLLRPRPLMQVVNFTVIRHWKQ